MIKLLMVTLLSVGLISAGCASMPGFLPGAMTAEQQMDFDLLVAELERWGGKTYYGALDKYGRPEKFRTPGLYDSMMKPEFLRLEDQLKPEVAVELRKMNAKLEASWPQVEEFIRLYRTGNHGEGVRSGIMGLGIRFLSTALQTWSMAATNGLVGVQISPGGAMLDIEQTQAVLKRWEDASISAPRLRYIVY